MCSLHKEDKELIRDLELKGVEKKVFDYTKSQKEDFSVADASNELQISEAHFRKAHSSVLQKTYKHLVPEQGIPLLRFLSRRQLHKQTYHELYKLEKKHLKAENTAELEKLFFNSVELFMNSDLSYFKPGFSTSLRNKYKTYGKDEPEYKHTILELQELYHEISVYSRKYALTDPNRIQFIKNIDKYSDYFKDKLLSTDIPEANFWYYYFMAHYSDNIENSLQQKLHYLEKAGEICDSNPGIFPEYYYINIKLNTALCYYDNSDFDHSYQVFNKVFEENPKWVKTSIFYMDIFVQLNIALGKFQAAKELLYLIYKFDQQKPWEYNGKNFGPLSILGLILLLQDEYEDAYKCIQKAQQLCVKTSFYYLESLIRILENSYFFLIGSYDIAEQLTSKNIKFHQYKKAGEEGEFFASFHKLIKEFSKYKYQDKLPASKYKTMYNKWMEAEFAFIGQLLKKMKTQAALNSWPA